MNLHVLLPLLLVPAKLLGVLGRKVGVPEVVGEIFAGLLFGPVFIGLLPTETSAPEQYVTFLELAQIGLCVLLFHIGIETNVKDFLRVWKPATGVAISGMVFPFVLGMGGGLALGWSPPIAAFVGATLTATSIGVTASVLDEVGGQASVEGKVILGAAVLDDIFGLVLLAAAAVMVTPGDSVVLPVALTFLQAIIFIGLSIWLGPWLVRGFMKISQWADNPVILLVFAFAFLLLMAWAAHAIGLAMIIGAYTAGLAFGGHPQRKQLELGLRPLVDLITPLFFILIGASIELHDFNPLTSSGLWAWIVFVLLFVAASAGKMLSPIFLGRGTINRLAIGSGMMPRGEVGFVFAQMGLSVSLFSQQQYSVLTLVLVATTFLGPLMLRIVWGRQSEKPPLQRKATDV